MGLNEIQIFTIDSSTKEQFYFRTAGSINSIVGVRERCDSLPSRGNAVVSTPRTNVSVGVNRYPTALRPHSMFVHGIGQSPPMMTNSPLSPNSGMCFNFLAQ